MPGFIKLGTIKLSTFSLEIRPSLYNVTDVPVGSKHGIFTIGGKKPLETSFPEIQIKYEWDGGETAVRNSFDH